MTNEVVKYAPKAVIEALDNWQEVTDTQLIYQLREDIEHGRFGLSEVNDWIYADEEYPSIWLKSELAVIEHVFGSERLQPEREPRWYVQDNVHGNTYWELDCNNHPAEWGFNAHGQPTYENGMTEKQARGYAELFGGEAKEIK